MTDTDTWSNGEIVRSLRRIEGDVKSMRGELSGLAAGFLPRSEFDVWAKARDREIADLKAARAPWWTWATILIAALSLLLALVPRLVS